MFDTKVALIVRNDLAIWQRLNVVAFLATGIASAAPEAMGDPYVDANGHRYGNMLGATDAGFRSRSRWPASGASRGT